MLSWKDQPACLLGSRRLCRFFLHGIGVSVEIRRKNNSYYVTTGNLFGSQTVRCPNSDTTFILVEKLNELNLKLLKNKRDLPDSEQLITLPSVCDVIPNRETELVES